MVIIIYKELSYKIMGTIFDVYNELGHGYQEKYYQKAIALRLHKNGLKFKEQLKSELFFDNKIIGKYFIDFLIEDKIILEIKVGDYFYKKDFAQVRSYLKSKKLELSIIVLFTKMGIKSKRILNKNA